MTQIWTAQNGNLVRLSGQQLVLLNENYDALPVSNPITIENFRSTLDWTGGGSGTVARTSIVAVAGRGNVVQQQFHAGQFGTADGIALSAPLTQSLDEAYIRYDVRFVGSNFDWQWGGKIPGLAGVLPGQGAPPSGGVPSPYGWGCRGMWITPDSYPGSSSSPNEWIGYMYDPTQSAGNYGQNRHTHQSFVADQWHTITQYYKMNTIATEGSSGNPNGIHRMWFDGNLVFENTTQVYRIYQNANITHIQWSLFYGGNTSDWATTIDTQIQIDNLYVAAGHP